MWWDGPVCCCEWLRLELSFEESGGTCAKEGVSKETNNRGTAILCKLIECREERRENGFERVLKGALQSDGHANEIVV